MSHNEILAIEESSVLLGGYSIQDAQNREMDNIEVGENIQINGVDIGIESANLKELLTQMTLMSAELRGAWIELQTMLR